MFHRLAQVEIEQVLGRPLVLRRGKAAGGPLAGPFLIEEEAGEVEAAKVGHFVVEKPD